MHLTDVVEIIVTWGGAAQRPELGWGVGEHFASLID